MAKKHSFSMIPRASMPRSVFDRSYTHKTTFFEGQLIPLFCQEILPGDSLRCKVSAVVRLVSPTDVPIMDDLYFDMQFFFVPNRLVWEHWQAFNGEQANPGDSTDYLVPTLEFPSELGGASTSDITTSSTDVNFFCLPVSGTIFDYFGIPAPQGCFMNSYDSNGSEELSYSRSGFSLKGQFNALPFRAYNLIWNEWYRDENLQERAYQTNGDGPDVVKSDEFLKAYDGSTSPFYAPLYHLLPRGKRHDYFTSCLPWPQKGPGVEVSIGGDIPIYGTGYGLAFEASSGPFLGTRTSNYFRGSSLALGTEAGTSSGESGSGSGIIGFATKDYFEENGLPAEYTGLYADGGAVSTITINDLRQAFQLQRLYERDARGGTRYIEILRSHFGVVSPDGRLQRPEYLGGFSQPLGAVNVPQTSATSDNGALGDLSSYICGQFSQNGFSRSFVEHGFVIGLASVRAPLSYSQGLHRMWSRKTRFDYYWPALAHLGEQAVLNKEIYFTGYPSEAPSSIFASGGNDDDVFGYQERWAEYRYSPNLVSGLFRPNTLDLALVEYGTHGAGTTYNPKEVDRVRLLPNGTVSSADVVKSDPGSGNNVLMAWAVAGTSLSFWHLSQVLGVVGSDGKIVPPALNASFISDMPPVSRVVAVPSEPHFNCDVGFNMRHARVMPAYSVPGLIDHF